MSKRILITGGAGFLGSHLCDRFIKEGYEVIAMDNLITGDVRNIEHLFPLKEFTFYNHDITKFIHVPGQIDYILHFASPASPIDYLKIPIQTLKVGAMGTHNCLGLAKAKGARMLIASTSEVYGDTRFDRVKEIEGNFLRIEFISEFIGNNKVVVAGSTWEDDEHLLASYFKKHPELKLILTPHEINQRHISSIKNSFPRCVLYSEYMIAINKEGSQVLIIDSVGLLSRLYNYATVTYVGGGFTKDGVHNVLEAAVWGKPVIFGPNYKKYREARELIKAGGGFSVSTTEELKQLVDDLFTNESNRQKTSKSAKAYIEENTGATKKIIGMIQAKRLLTN